MIDSPLKLERTLCACGAVTRNRARPSELTCGYCLPAWFSGDGLKSATGWVVLAPLGTPASRGSRAIPRRIRVVFMVIPPDRAWVVDRRRSVYLFPLEMHRPYGRGAGRR